YWDWVIDRDNLTQAPLWASAEGFGGDGDHSVKSALGDYCVADGPFQYLQVKYIKEDIAPHCLSRGFATGDRLRELSSWIQPEQIETCLAEDDYDTFNLCVELGPHNAIPRSIGGDFTVFTAPIDPVFFLHHTQIDRLWWKWQDMDVEKRMWQYRGQKSHTSKEPASLTDIISMGGLAPDIVVESIIDTEGSLLHYSY
ncbi:MAG: hypothetical protein MMC23_007440, partial [Stictis urceolatum]|nr:hypothetical protein [Stictis urceolata]